ncbi:hypothetical protein N7449_008510 [Penicillium cf. viridicatum]|uniref:Uncharacterized protein n=1 Tax=Penicillium cf. viridicatum TaxID=2972119 RepID=A0A9W9M856_9EURO|nr:hypothetical protein N7449_008510 [Penicillium cf. viridicatum]
MENPIPSPDNERLELLTQLRLARTRRTYSRIAIIREGREIIREVQLIGSQYAAYGRAPPVHLLWRLDQSMESVFHHMLALLTEEDAARAFEAEVWHTLA